MGSDKGSENSFTLSDESESPICSGERVDPSVNILLVGDSGVGKTDLIGRLTDEEFKTKFCATIGINMETHTLDVDGNSLRLQIWDPSGSDRYRTVITKCFHSANGIMFVYDVNYRTSFESIKVWIHNIQHHPDISQEDVQKILIGNKCDIDKRAVSTEEGQNLADEYGMKFLETSSITGMNVQKAFYSLCKEIKPSPKKSDKNLN